MTMSLLMLIRKYLYSQDIVLDHTRIFRASALERPWQQPEEQHRNVHYKPILLIPDFKVIAMVLSISA